MSAKRPGLAVCVLTGLVAVVLLPGGAAGQAGEANRTAAIDAGELLMAAEQEFARGDVVAAMQLLRDPATNGFVPAQVQLAYYLDYAEQDEDAFRWYRSAAEAGNAEAQFKLGKLYATGEGTGRDLNLASSWFHRSGEQGYPAAIRMLATSYEQGGDLVSISYERAVEWLQVGVAELDIWSIRRLSEAYRTGALGLRINREKAAALDEKARALDQQLKVDQSAVPDDHPRGSG